MAQPGGGPLAGAVLLDQRGVSKLAHFTGKREDFENCIFPFESSTGLLGWQPMMEAARDMAGETDPNYLGPQAADIGRSLYHLLVSCVHGPVLSIVKLTPRAPWLRGAPQAL